MATSTTITGLTALSPSAAPGDYLVIVDVSDSSEAVTGTTKKISVATFLTAATLQGPTITSGAAINGLTYITESGVPLLLNNTSVAAINPAVTAQRGGVTRYGIGFNASDEFAILNAAESTVNLSITDLGAATLRAGLTAATVIVGTDPGGSGVLRVGGNVNVAGLSAFIALDATTVGQTAFIRQSIAGVNKWAFGPNVNTTSNAWDLFNYGLSDSAISVNATTNGITFPALSATAVSLGAADSGGAGFKLLRVPN